MQPRIKNHLQRKVPIRNRSIGKSKYHPFSFIHELIIEQNSGIELDAMYKARKFKSKDH